MTPLRSLAASSGRPLRLYALGHAGLLLGTWAMTATGSMLPMALAASASLMLTMPIVRHVLAAHGAPRR